jgi:hypothetical protein
MTTTRTLSLVLPRLAGTREAARDLAEDQQLPPTLRDLHVELLCGELASGSTSFADELVSILFADRNAASVELIGAPYRFVNHFRASADRRGFADRVRVHEDY